MGSGKGNEKKWMVNGNRARDDKEKNQHNRTTGNRSGRVEISFPDFDELVARAELSISINEVSEEEIIIVNELNEVYDLGEKAERIIFKKVDFMRLNAAV